MSAEIQILKDIEEDKLNRRQLAENFAKIVLSNNQSKVFTINSPWGSGKSFFIDNLLIPVIEDKALCVKYNAWQSDFYNNPLSPIIYELTNEICRKKGGLEEEVSKIKQFAKDLSFSFSANLHFISIKADKDKTVITDYKDLKERIKSLKNELSRLQISLGLPIIIFIDELDRCRPDYAIKTLEIIKHLFDVDNVKIIIAIDGEQLSNFVQTIYGEKTYTAEFLRKFIDIQFYFPTPNLQEFTQQLLSKIPDIKNKIDNGQLSIYKGKKNESYSGGIMFFEDFDESKFISFITDLKNDFRLELRDLEKIFLRLNLVLQIFDNKTLILIDVLLFMLTCHIKNYTEYNELLKSGHSIDIRLKHVQKTQWIANGFLHAVFYTARNKPKDPFVKNYSHKDNSFINSYDILSYFDMVDFAGNFEK